MVCTAGGAVTLDGAAETDATADWEDAGGRAGVEAGSRVIKGPEVRLDWD